MTPEGWRSRRLGDVADIAIGGTPSRAEPAFWDRAKAGSNRWVAISDLKARRIADTAEYITDLGVLKSNVKLVPPKTPIMSFKLSIGRTAMTEVPLYTNEAIAAFLPREPFSPEYLQYALPSAAMSVEADTAVKGQTLNKAKLKEITILLPPLHEQHKVAAILSSVDDAIEATQAVIDQLQVVKKAMMAELFTRGLPGRHTRFKQTEIGEVPEEWDILPFESLLAEGDALSYGILQPGDDETGGVPMLRTVDLDEHGGRSGTEILRVDAKIETAYARTRLRGGEVLLSVMGTVGRTVVVPAEWRGWNVNRALAVIRLNDRAAARFLSFWLRSPSTQARFLIEQIGSAQKRINLGDLRQMQVPIPNADEQVSICETLATLEARQETETQVLSAVQQAKSALMSVLLTGEVRVTPDEAAA